MILLVHLLVGAAIGSYFSNFWLIIFLSIISHLVIDRFPHRDYNFELTDGISKIEAIKVFLDFSIGTGLALIFIWKSPVMIPSLVGMFSGIIPDILIFAEYLSSNSLLKKINFFHRCFLHPKDNEKISLSWAIFFQIGISLLAMLFLAQRTNFFNKFLT